MSGPYRPSDDFIGVVFLGALFGLIGGSLLGESLIFFVVGVVFFLGVMSTIIKSGEDDDEPQRPDKT